MLSIVRNVLNKTDEVYNNIDVENDKHPYAKAAGCGFVEGVIDGAVICYPMLLVGCWYWKHKALKK